MKQLTHRGNLASQEKKSYKTGQVIEIVFY